MTTPTCALAFLSFAALCAATASAQQTLKVPSASFPTIASAIAAANSGDTIQIGPNNAPGSLGVYSEILVVPNTKTGLHFKGSNTVWDGGATNDILTFAGPNDGVVVEGFVFRNGNSQIVISGNDATVTKCTFQNSQGGQSITIIGNSATVTGVTIRGGADAGIVILGTDGIVDKCTMDSIDSLGVLVLGGDRTTVSNCKISRSQGEALFVGGNDVVITKNTITDTGGIGLGVDGDRATIEGNKIQFASGNGIDLSAGSDDAKINANTISDVQSIAIDVDGAHATITKNKIDRCQAGIRVDNGSTAVLGGPTISSNSIKSCRGGSAIDVDADSVTILSNTIDRVLAFNRGILVISLGLAAQGGSIANNKISNCGFRGIDVNCDSIAISQNSVKRAGTCTNTSAAIRVAGNSCTVVGNSASEIFGDGFQISGNSNTITDCKASKCRFDGYDVAAAADANTFDGCSATDCGAEGFDNSNAVTNTSVSNCTFSKCRIDFAGNGTLAQDLSNTFTTGGAATAPEID